VYVLDLGMYMDLDYMVRRSTHDVAEVLDEIRKEMKKWTKGAGGLQVQTSDARKTDRKSMRWMKSQAILANEEIPNWKRRIVVLDRLGA
jgi:hypothetical protein